MRTFYPIGTVAYRIAVAYNLCLLTSTIFTGLGLRCIVLLRKVLPSFHNYHL